MKVTASAASGPGPSPTIEKYMDREITSRDYFREVREETAKQVDRELTETPTTDNGSKDTSE